MEKQHWEAKTKVRKVVVKCKMASEVELESKEAEEKARVQAGEES